MGLETDREGRNWLGEAKQEPTQPAFPGQARSRGGPGCRVLRPLRCAQLAWRFPACWRHCRARKPKMRTAERSRPQRQHPSPRSGRWKRTGCLLNPRKRRFTLKPRVAGVSINTFTKSYNLWAYFIVLTYILTALNNKNRSALTNNGSKRRETERGRERNRKPTNL